METQDGQSELKFCLGSLMHSFGEQDHRERLEKFVFREREEKSLLFGDKKLFSKSRVLNKGWGFIFEDLN